MIKKRTLDEVTTVNNNPLVNKRQHVDNLLLKKNVNEGGKPAVVTSNVRYGVVGSNSTTSSKTNGTMTSSSVNNNSNSTNSMMFSRKPAQMISKKPVSSIPAVNIAPTINTKNLMQNLLVQESESHANKEITKKKASVKEQRAKNLLSEVDELLNKKSSHAQEADNEWHEAYSQRMTKLAQKEYAQQKAEERQSETFQITAFSCITCEHFITELFPQLCEEQKHSIAQIRVNKRSFECGQCHRKEYTYQQVSKDTSLVQLPPNHRCITCGAYNWLRVGQQASLALSAINLENSSQQTNISNTEGLRFVASASDATSKQEKLEMARRVSSLL